MRRFYIILLSVFLFSNVNAQYANNWELGNGFGLNFSSSTPTVITGAISGHVDNTTTISDTSGNLLFYTTGLNVWNKNHLVMPNGSGLIGTFSAGQCALIVPIPCSSKYVIFHLTYYSNPGNLSYSVVDMSLNSGLGDVVAGQKNISLGSGWTEKLCAYYNPSTNSYWLLTNKWMSNQFVAFKIDATTIATTSVVTSIGSIHNCGTVGGVHDAMGQLTISPDGKKVLNALTCQDKYELFDFDINTGILSNSISISGNSGNAWGTVFSPDSKKIYTSVLWGTFGGDLYQYDISTYSSSAILASKYKVYSTGVSSYNFGYMELGPDGKIYIPRPGTNFLSVINSPNSLLSACNFSFSGLSIGSNVTQHGISRVAYNIPTSSTITPTFSLTIFSNSATCNGFSNGSAAVFANPSGSYSYSWSPGSNTTSFNNNLAAGVYSVTVSNGNCGSITNTVSVTQPQPLNINIDPLQICSGNSGPLNATAVGGTPAYTYSWSTGATGSGILVSPPTSTNYTLYVTDANGCIGTAIATVSVSPCTSVHEKEITSSVVLYPNPFTETLHVQSTVSIDEVIITNVLGALIKKVKLTNGSFDTKDLQAGIYFIQLYSKNNLPITKRVVKSN